MADKKLTIKIEAKDQASDKLEKVNQEVNNLGKGASITQGLLGGLNTKLLGWITAIAGGFLTVKTAFSELKESVHLYSVQLQSEMSTIQALVVAGVGNVTAALKEYKNLASSLQGKTIFGDEEILQGMALFQKLTLADKEAVEEITPAILDMASATGMDLKNAFQIVARALETNGTSLRRYGIDVKLTGDRQKDLAIITKELTKRFGGMSEIIAKTPTGKLQQMSNLIGDIKEKIGEVIAGNKGIQTLFNILKEGITDFGNKAPRILSNILINIGYIIRGVGYLIQLFSPIIAALKAIWDFLKNGIYAVIGLILQSLEGWLLIAEKVTAIFDKDMAASIHKTVEEIRNFRETAFQSVKPLEEVTDNFMQTGAKALEIGDTLNDIGKKLGEQEDYTGKIENETKTIAEKTKTVKENTKETAENAEKHKNAAKDTKKSYEDINESIKEAKKDQEEMLEAHARMVDKVRHGILDALKGLGDLFKGIRENMWGVLTEFSNYITRVADTTSDLLVKGLLFPVEGILGLIISTMRALGIDKLLGSAKEGKEAVLEQEKKIKSGVSSMAEGMKAIADTAKQFILSMIEALAENIDTIVESLIEIVIAVVNALPKIITDVLPKLVIVLIKAIPPLVRAIIKAIPQIVKALFIALWEMIKEIGKMIRKAVVEFIPNLIKEIADSLENGIKNLGKEFVDALGL